MDEYLILSTDFRMVGNISRCKSRYLYPPHLAYPRTWRELPAQIRYKQVQKNRFKENRKTGLIISMSKDFV